MTSVATPAPAEPAPSAPGGLPPDPSPPALAEVALGALVADAALREAVLGDLAELFAAHRERHGTTRARRWYRAQAVRSAPALVAATWWPAPARRARRLGALAAGVAGSVVLVQLVHQAAQLLAAAGLAAAGLATHGWPHAAASLAAGAGCGVLGGYVAARALRDAPLAGALALAAACAALAVVGIAVNDGGTPLWYWVGLQLLILPVGACGGGLLRARHAAQH